MSNEELFEVIKKVKERCEKVNCQNCPLGSSRTHIFGETIVDCLWKDLTTELNYVPANLNLTAIKELIFK